MSVDMHRAIGLVRELRDALNHHCGSTYSDSSPEDEALVEEARQFLTDAGAPL